MITLNDIIEYYNDIKLMRGQNLREDMFLKRILFKFCSDLHSNQRLAGNFNDMWLIQLPRSFTHKPGWAMVRKGIDKFFKSSGKTINVSLKDHLEIMAGHYIESLYAFERSIFWFFNYKHNLDPFNQVASEQALYYSEFFSIVAITRFLGSSLSHTPLGLFKVIIDWQNTNISIYHRPNSRSSHGSYIDLFLDLLDNIDFTGYKYLETLKSESFFRDRGFLMIEDRKENVYDLSSRMSDPFKNAVHADFCEPSIKATKSWNFLEGLDKAYSRVSHSDYDGNLAEYLNNQYADEGYRQHYIGEYWKFLIYIIKKIKGTKEYIRSLIWKLKRFEQCESAELDDSTKDILLRWLNED